MMAFLLLAIAGCTSQPAEVTRISDPLLAPSPQAPPDGKVYRYRLTGEPPLVELVWRHGMPSAQVPSPHQAERMIICVYDEQRGRCESGSRVGVPQPIWLEADADDPAINRTPIRQKQLPFVSTPDIHLGYEFRTSLRMRPGYANRSLLWQVGACLGGTCRISDPQRLRMTRPEERVRDLVPGT